MCGALLGMLLLEGRHCSSDDEARALASVPRVAGWCSADVAVVLPATRTSLTLGKGRVSRVLPRM